MLASTTSLHDMCGATPVSAEDAVGIAAAAQRLKDRPVQEHPEIEWQPVSYEAMLPRDAEQLSRDLTDAARDDVSGG
jgi:hypothetical protein